MKYFKKQIILTAASVLLLSFMAGCESGDSKREFPLEMFVPVAERVLDTSNIKEFPYSEVSFFETSDGKFIATFDYNSWNLFIFSPQTGKQIYNVPIGKVLYENEHLSNIFVNGFFIQNLDSIYILLNPQNKLLLFNVKGEIQNQWTVDENRKNGNKYGLLTYSNPTPMVLKDNKLLVSQQLTDGSFADDLSVRRTKFSSPADVIIELQDSSYNLKELGIFPAVFAGDNFYYDVIGSRTVNDRFDLVYSYGISDSIIIATQSGEITYKEAKSTFIDNNEFTPFDVEYYRDGGYRSKYISEQPRYRDIIYDKYNQLYYRIAIHSQPYENEDGTQNTLIDKPWSIVVLDTKFKKIGEQYFKPKEYNFLNYILTDEGLMIAYHELNSSNKHGKLCYKIFKIKNGIK